MIDDFTPFYRKASFWRFLVIWGMFLLFVLFFWNDLGPVIKGCWNLAVILVGNGFYIFNDTFREQAFLASGFDQSMLESMARVLPNFIIYFLMYFVSLFMVSQFTLPVRIWKHRRAAFASLLNYRLGWYGLTAFVREGKLIAKTGEEESIKPGVILVDLSSAAVLASQPWEERPTQDEGKPKLHIPKREHGSMRVVGPGVHFINAGEKLRTLIDLRKQFRTTPGVKAITRDGIEIETAIFTVFSVSEPSEIIPVAYVGGTDSKHIFALELSEDRKNNTISIKRKWSLDPQDAEEIHRAVEAGTVKLSITFSALPVLNRKTTPYFFDEDRVFRASCADALNSSNSNQVTPWHELTQPICIDIFQSLLSRYTYDNLFALSGLTEVHTLKDDLLAEQKLKDGAEFSKTLKAELSFRMRCQGILSYKLVKIRTARDEEIPHQIRWNEDSLDDEHIHPDKVYPGQLFNISAPHLLTNSKVIRDRGIKIIAAGFTQIVSPPEVRKQVIKNWRARSEREIDITLAKYERDAMQVINNARTQMQRENAYHLSGIFNKGEHSDEALALLIFQALENIATNPKSRKDIPPKEILAMLQNLHRWLLTERKEIFKPPRTGKGKASEDDQ